MTAFALSAAVRMALTGTMAMTGAVSYSTATPPPPPAPSTGTPQPFTLTSPNTGVLPFAVGYAMSQGHVPSGSSLSFTGITGKLVVLSTWPDGSARHGIIAGTYTSAGAAVTVTPTVATVAAGTALTGAAVQTAMGANTAAFDAGAFGSATFSGTDFASPFKTHAATDAFIEAIYRKAVGSDTHLVAWLSLRVWSSGQVEALPWIENGYLNVASPVNKSATFTFTLGGTSRFSGAIDLPNHCRTPLVSGSALSHWLGTDPQVTPTHDKPYLMATRLVPSYGGTVSPSSATVTGLPSTYAPLQQGSFPSAMGNAGYHPSIGVLPQWDAAFLCTTATSVWAALQRNAYSAGRFGMHFRDEVTNRPINFASYPNLCVGGGSNIIGTGSSSLGTYTPTASGTAPAQYNNTHLPSMGYMAYLLTGRFFHLETVQFSAGINYLKNSDGNRNGSQGVFLTTAGANTVRGTAWSLRTLAQAVAATPDADPLKTPLQASLTANVNWYHTRYVAQANNPQGWVQPYNDYTGAVFATTQAGSTSTAIVLPSAYVFPTDNLYNGWEIVIGGQVRTATGYVGSTYTATVSPAFGVSTVSQPFELRNDVIWAEAAWQQDFLTAALGYAKALQLHADASGETKIAALFDWKARSIVGRFGSPAPDEYLYRDAGVYNIAVAPSNAPDWTTGTGPWYSTWGEVYRDTIELIGDPGARVEGDLRGDSGNWVDASSYWGNLQPALAYAVEHGADGAGLAWQRMTSAGNWGTFSAGFNTAPEWGVVPINDPRSASWVAAEGTFASVSTNTMRSAVPDSSAWPNSDNGGPFSNWGGGRWVADFGKYGAYVLQTSGHLIPPSPIWSGVPCWDLETRAWVYRAYPPGGLIEPPPASFETYYNDYFESVEAGKAGHIYVPHTYGGNVPVRTKFGGGKDGSLVTMAVPGYGARNNRAVHKSDLSKLTDPPTRVINAMAALTTINNYPMAALDESRGGFWALQNNGNGAVNFVRFSDWNESQPGGVGYNDYGDHCLIHIPAPWDMLVGMGRSGSGGVNLSVWAAKITGSSVGTFTQYTYTGTPPTDRRCGGVWSKRLKCIVSYSGNGSAIVHKLLVPRDLATGSFVWTSETLTGASGATPSTTSGTFNGEWSNMQEAEHLGTMIRCGGINAPVQSWTLRGMRSADITWLRDAVWAGDSLTADSYPSCGLRWGMALAGAPLRMVYNAGVPNDTLDDLWARWTTDVLNKLPNGGVILLRIGTNSISDGSFQTKYQRFVTSVLASTNLRIVMFAIPPKQTNGSTIVALNAIIEGMVQQNSHRLMYLQDSTALGDSSYNVISGSYIDGIHMNAVGQYAQGLAMAPLLRTFFGPAPSPLPTTGTSYATDIASNQWVKNPLMSGSSPTATDWAVGATGGGTSVTGTVVAADGGDANQTPWQRVTINSLGGATHTLGCATTLAHPAITSGGSPARIEIVAEVRFNALNTTAIEKFDVNLTGSQIAAGWKNVGLLGNGTVSKTLLIHQSLERNLAQTASANSLVLSFDITAAGAAGSIGSFDVRCAAVRALES